MRESSENSFYQPKSRFYSHNEELNALSSAEKIGDDDIHKTKSLPVELKEPDRTFLYKTTDWDMNCDLTFYITTYYSNFYIDNFSFKIIFFKLYLSN